MEDRKLFLLRAEKEGDRRFSLFERRSSTPPLFFFRPIFDPFFGAEDRRWRGSSIFGSEGRKLKKDVRSSNSKIEDRVLRSSASKNEERRENYSKNPPYFEEPPSSRNSPFFEEFPLLSSFLGSEDRRNSPSSIYRCEDCLEDRRGPRGGQGRAEQSTSRRRRYDLSTGQLFPFL